MVEIIFTKLIKKTCSNIDIYGIIRQFKTSLKQKLHHHNMIPLKQLNI